jgi:hypothetical protein
MADDGEWQCLDAETLPPLERLLPGDVYQALLDEIKRQRSAMPPASGSGINHLNTIPSDREDALSRKQSPLHYSAQTVGTRIWLAWKPMMTVISKIFRRSSKR